jgi:hypothetical protein
MAFGINDKDQMPVAIRVLHDLIHLKFHHFSILGISMDFFRFEPMNWSTLVMSLPVRMITPADQQQEEGMRIKG